MANCDHIVGKAFKLNPEEGPAWINVYVRESSKGGVQEDDWTSKFAHCPVCGVKVAEPDDSGNFLQPLEKAHA